MKNNQLSLTKRARLCFWPGCWWEKSTLMYLDGNGGELV